MEVRERNGIESQSNREGEMRECKCGCGQAVKGFFAQGHNARYRGQLINELKMGWSEAAIREIGEHSWTFDRTFGVEIEFFGISKDAAREALLEMGISVKWHGYTHQTTDWWKIVRDGSVNNKGTEDGSGLELVSPILKGIKGLEQVKLAVKTLKEAGAKVDSSCGLHIHLGTNGFTIERFRRVLRFYTTHTEDINSMMDESRRYSTYCGPWRADSLELAENARSMSALVRAQGDRYRSVNLEAFPRHGTIEFRQHQGTLNGREIERWIRFVMGMAWMSRFSWMDRVRPWNHAGKSVSWMLPIAAQ